VSSSGAGRGTRPVAVKADAVGAGRPPTVGAAEYARHRRRLRKAGAARTLDGRNRMFHRSVSPQRVTALMPDGGRWVGATGTAPFAAGRLT